MQKAVFSFPPPERQHLSRSKHALPCVCRLAPTPAGQDKYTASSQLAMQAVQSTTAALGRGEGEE